MKAEQRNFVLPVRVYYEDTDAAGMVYYANYLKFMERARTDWIRALGFEHSQVMQELGVAFVVRTAVVEYLKPARLDDALEIVSSIESLGRAQVVFAQNVERRGDSLVMAKIRVACVDPVRGKPCAIPRMIHEIFNALTETGTRTRT